MHAPGINPFIWLILTVLDLYYYVVLAWFIFSWLITLNIINRYQPIVQRLNYAFFKLTDPILRHIRKYMPHLGGFDLSPIVLIIAIHFLERLIVYYALRW